MARFVLRLQYLGILSFAAIFFLVLALVLEDDPKH
jgi:hypothetical protein